MNCALKLKIFSCDFPISDRDFENFYSLMLSSFPKSEIRTKDAFLKLCRENPLYKIYALFNNDTMAAFFTLWELGFFNFGDHFAVDPDMRCGGIGSFLLSQVISSSKLPLVLEVEPADFSPLAARRIEFYKRNGFHFNSFSYAMPPMQKGFQSIPMHLLSAPSSLLPDEFEKVKSSIYQTVYNV